MTKKKALLSAWLLASASMTAAATAQPASTADPYGPSAWGIAATDVTPDPSIRYGRLPNGMKYAIVRNGVPKGAAAVRLHFDFGSIGEKENERGLAHFIEHMAFNGTTNVPEGEMVRILERQGLKFGPDTNAATGFDTTMYMLDLPQVDEKRVDTAMMLLREVAGNVTFDEAAVNRERGVLLGERRARENFQLRQIEDTFRFLLPDAPYADRFPIGTQEVIRNASASTIKSLYQRYYRPENATFIFVGDIDPAAIESKIRQTFSDWKGVGPAGAELDRGRIDLRRPTDVDTFIDPASAQQITIQSYRPWSDPADTRAERRRDLIEALARAMFNRRMQRIVNAPDSVLLYGGMTEADSEDLALGANVTVVAKDGAWKEGVAIAEQELRRVIEYGFTRSELDLQRADALGRLKTAAGQANSRTHQGIANAIVATIDTTDFVTAPAWDLSFYEEVAPSITIAEVNDAVRHVWSGSAPLIHVSSKTPVTEEEIASAFAGSAKLAVAPPKETEALAFAYDDWGTPGTIVADRRIEDVGVRTLRFANNVKLNIKKTDFEPGKVAFAVRMAGGSVLLPKDKPGLSLMTTLLSSLAATQKHSLEDIKLVSAGRQVTSGIMAHPDAFGSRGVTTPSDLEMQMQLSAAYLTDPGLRPEADAQWQNLSSVIAKQFEAVPKTLHDLRLPYLLSGEDGRFGAPPGEMFAERRFAELAPILAAAKADAPIEVTIVGDVDEQAAIDAVAKSFGALPPREAARSIDPALRKVAFMQPGETVRLVHKGDADQALVGAVWQTDDDADYRQLIGLNVLTEVLDLMLTEKVREELGASYGVSVTSVASSVFDDYGYVWVNSVVAPEEVKKVDEAIAEAVAKLRNTPIDADMLARARNPVLEGIAKSRRQNSYWLGVLDEAQTRPDRLDRIRQREALVKAVSAADIQALARKYLAPDRKIEVRVTSDKAAASASS